MDMPATRLEVVLPPEYDQKLRQQVMATINEAVKSARQQTYIDSPWLPSKAAAAKYLGMSNNTLTTLIKAGLPVHFLPDVAKYTFNKHEINEWLLNL